MKRLLLGSVCCVASLGLYGQDVLGTWKVDAVLWKTSRQVYHLQRLDSSDEGIYGNYLIFNRDNTFESYYTAFCGNDCFSSSKGVYKILKNNRIKLVLKEVRRKGFEVPDCLEIHEKGVWSLGIYSLKKTEQGVILTKMRQ